MNQWEWNLLEDKAQLDHVEIAGTVVKKGDRVRLRSQGAAATFWTSRCAGRSQPSKALKRTTKARSTSAWSLRTIPGAILE